MLNTEQIRSKYLEYFKNKGHVVVPSSSLVPEGDATTLFTGSGMQPMVPYLLGQEHAMGRRLTDSQKSFRAEDIEEVGDNRHTTFFEMLGNWSLGDYFKSEQIKWMFGFLIEELALDPNRLYVSCFRGSDVLGIPKDTESAQLWAELFASKGVSAEIADEPETLGMQGARIFYYPEKKNWWSRSGVPANMPVGEPGGPDTEMFWDFGAERNLHEVSQWKDEPCHVNCDCGRFVEIGNNVFMQYQKTEDGFVPLKQKNVDFGGGLERMAAAVLDNPDVFYISLFDGAREALEKLTGNRYGNDANTFAMRVILDHLRAAVFLISDGVLPSNKTQGYVLRRLIRRALVMSRNFNLPDAWIADIALAYIETYKTAYPELAEKSDAIILALQTEEKKFSITLTKGLKEFDKLVLKQGDLTGTDAFNLYQTFGFPWEVSHELALGKGLQVSRDEFQSEFLKHQELSRTSSSGEFKGGLGGNSPQIVAFHTATHLLHKALKEVLGADVVQKGSNITEERLRFDFAYGQKMSDEQKKAVEDLINSWILRGLAVKREEVSFQEAVNRGAIGLFGEKYGDTVSIYTIFDDGSGEVISLEFCGGPHVNNTSEIGGIKIAKEEAVSAGVRRIKAVRV